jgi:hypothetical protein
MGSFVSASFGPPPTCIPMLVTVTEGGEGGAAGAVGVGAGGGTGSVGGAGGLASGAVVVSTGAGEERPHALAAERSARAPVRTRSGFTRPLWSISSREGFTNALAVGNLGS